MNLMIFNCKIFIFSKKYLNIQFYHNNKKYRSLLEALEIHRIPLLNYQCRSGYCGSCRALLIKGKVQYHKEPLGYTSSNEILTCCCAPIEHIILKLL
ncbi:class I ribonucleotide reductase maintenance protein YfaE [Candidatus Blochmannia vicinus (nom. nud.)]|uniref:Class I ribonucleotide reductase maintenance protein YfaE n=1 Tax=Candidatus Blochmannia vicinus (nom. nud.) TaxID=251540 RepID=A0A9Q8TYA6_9ENTR|nr:class I ribonucleotide reductase maintenance protein YfaE [Candidatus Blochmannia vicinus]URJ28291.1 class I ribonucleotide reductase maintenance protein YfaE [Candidatus Blochmannia vicinus]URJ30433.1 class I ribonucleotide reductase maintenance protein YfaE [Candidatus Blochmannia vicinus]